MQNKKERVKGGFGLAIQPHFRAKYSEKTLLNIARYTMIIYGVMPMNVLKIQTN